MSGLRVGSTATYKCDDGFLLVGTTTRECLSNGQWSGNAPICKRKYLLVVHRRTEVLISTSESMQPTEHQSRLS